MFELQRRTSPRNGNVSSVPGFPGFLWFSSSPWFSFWFSSGFLLYNLGGPEGGLTVGNIGLNTDTSPDETISEYAFSSPYGTSFKALTPLGTDIVFLNSSYFSYNITLDNTTLNIPTNNLDRGEALFHEMFHTLNIGDLGDSSAFDTWIKGGCQGEPPQ